MRVLDVLVVVANPYGTTQINAEGEVRAINDELRAAVQQGRATVRTAMAATLDDLHHGLLGQPRPGLVHVIGHGGKGGSFVFETDDRNKHEVAADGLAGLLGQFSQHISLVIFSACHGTSLANAACTHIDHAVGFDGDVTPAASRVAVRALYRSLVAGEPIQQAVDQAEARKAAEYPRAPQMRLFPAEPAPDVGSTLDAAASPTIKRLEVDVAVLVTQHDELDQLKSAFECTLSAVRDAEYGGYDYRFDVGHYRCVTSVVGGMGPAKAGRHVDQVFARWNPRVAVTVGVAVSLHSDLLLCDVLIAEQLDMNAASPEAISIESKYGWLTYTTAHALLQDVANLPYSHASAYSAWQESCSQDLLAKLPADQGSRLRRDSAVREAPRSLLGDLMNDPMVKKNGRITAAVPQRGSSTCATEAGLVDLVTAATERRRPIPILVLRGISRIERQGVPEVTFDHDIITQVAMCNTFRLLKMMMVEGLLLRAPRPPSRSTMRLQLTVEGVVQSVHLQDGIPVCVGRAADNDLVLPASDRKAARTRHVTATARGQRVEIKVYSKNGILIASERVPHRAVVSIAVGESFVCGSTEISLLGNAELKSTMTDSSIGSDNE